MFAFLLGLLFTCLPLLGSDLRSWLCSFVVPLIAWIVRACQSSLTSLHVCHSWGQTSGVGFVPLLFAPLLGLVPSRLALFDCASAPSRLAQATPIVCARVAGHKEGGAAIVRWPVAAALPGVARWADCIALVVIGVVIANYVRLQVLTSGGCSGKQLNWLGHRLAVGTLVP